MIFWSRSSLVFAIAAGCPATALAAKALVRAVHSSEPKAIISSPQLRDLRSGDMLEIADNCLLEVGKIAGDRALVSTRLCPNRSLLVKVNREIPLEKRFKAETVGLIASTGALPPRPQAVGPLPGKSKAAPSTARKIVSGSKTGKARKLPEKTSPAAPAVANAIPPAPVIERRETIVQPIIIQQPAVAPAPRSAVVVTRVPPEEVRTGFVTRGFRMGIVKNWLSFETIDKGASTGSGSATDETLAKGYFAQEIGFAIGYAAVGYLQPGFAGKFSFNQFASGIDSYRVDLNGALGVSRYLYLYLGLNSNWFSDADALPAGLGYQTGLGVQMTRNLGLDIGYLRTVNRGKINSLVDPAVRLDRQFELSGLEVGLHGTF
jgi:hypothetical protein